MLLKRKLFCIRHLTSDIRLVRLLPHRRLRDSDTEEVMRAVRYLRRHHALAARVAVYYHLAVRQLARLRLPLSDLEARIRRLQRRHDGLTVNPHRLY